MGQTLIGLLQKTSSHNRPRQIAWAIAWGCVCGLIPKSSLLFPLALMVSVLLPMHLVAAMICMLITSCLSPLLHPTLGNVGHWMFGSLGFAPIVHKLESYPLIPWMKLHNTVVIGALLLSFVAFVPTYWIMLQIVAPLYARWLKLQPEVQTEEVVQFELIPETTHSPAISSSKQVTTALTSQQTAVDSSPLPTTLKPNPIHYNVEAVPQRPPVVAPEVAPRPLAAALDQFDASMSSLSSTSQTGDSKQVQGCLTDVIDSIHALENLLEQAGFDTTSPLDAQAVLARATRATELVDDILNSLDAIDTEAASAEASVSEKTSGMVDRSLPIDSNEKTAEPKPVTSVEAQDKTSVAATPLTQSTPLRSMRGGVDRPTVQSTRTGPTASLGPTAPPSVDAPQASPTVTIWLDPSALPKVRVDAAQIYQSHDTKISIYRRARTGETTVSTSDTKTPLEKDSMSTASETTDQQANLAVVVPPQSSTPSTRHSGSTQTAEANAAIRKHDNTRHEEALRHLLDHLRALKEKV